MQHAQRDAARLSGAFLAPFFSPFAVSISPPRRDFGQAIYQSFR